MVLVGHPVVRLVQVQIIHHPLGVGLLRVNYLREERILSADPVYNDVPSLELLLHHRVRGTVYVDALILQVHQIISVPVGVVPVEVRVLCL